MADEKSKIEIIILRVGAVCGILVALLTLWNGITKPSEPDLTVNFALTGADELAISPIATSPKDDWTVQFPIGLRVRNSGGKTAKNVILRLGHPRNFIITSEEFKSSSKLIYSGSSQKVLTTISLGDINPHQTMHLDNAIWAYTENIANSEVDIESADKVPLTVPFSITATFELEVQASANDVTEIERKLYVTVGPEDYFQKNNMSYISVKDGKYIIDTK